MTAREDYARALDYLRMLAQADLLSFWRDTQHLGFMEQRRVLESPVMAIVEAYGAQAAEAAANYLFIERSLDEDFADLPYPEVASPIDFDQAKTSYRWATTTESVHVDDAAKALALRKLKGITNRLVGLPGHQTVYRATYEAKTNFARVPEPGACPFCLMLASRGAVYSAETVLTAHSIGAFHDNCRCLGIEVRRKNDLPQINQDLEALWAANSNRITRSKAGSLTEWSRILSERKRQFD